MIDFLKMDISYLSRDHLLNLDKLDFNGKVDLTTGEVHYPYRAKDYDYRFKINPKVKEVTGSIHKTINLFNGVGNHNYNDLSIKDITRELQRLFDDYGIDPSRTRIKNIEYGFNFIVDTSPSSIITNHIVAWDRYAVNRNVTYDKTGKYYKWNRSQIALKIYDKSAQYNLKNHVMRFEKRISKSEYLNKLGIVYLSDLTKIECLETLTTDLLSSYDKLIFIDSFDPDVLDPKEKSLWSRMTNPKYYEHYSSRSNTDVMRKRHQRDMKMFRSVIDSYQLETAKRRYRQRIECKIKKFLNVTE